ncbi:peptidase T [Defluviitalea raffinosedens]|uniref:Peptidase T n=1 Tax=Defluviitalea raffinosedens TaxID=1450156 RepID=A0A7C8LGE5_9FIRM|nr:peptidase T [Defluviitalea raffinosedens]KAE9636916.1 peptidase T [Defluviitalea raffinosedens]
MNQLVERFIKYVKYPTTSDESSNTCPSTENQIAFGKMLAEECKSIGLKDISIDENGYVMAVLPANCEEDVPVIGFIAHMDTSPDMSGENVNPRIIENYNGKDIVLNEEKNIVLSPNTFPNLTKCIGDTLITTDGTTLLGADDKAGIAEILTAMEYLIHHPEIKHGKICIAFTPDEEIGRGADLFDVKKFGADFAYTIDGGLLGELEYENFNAAQAKITIHGQNVHPGTAKNKMKNAVLIGIQLAQLFPEKEIPAHTEGYEGFYHLNNFNGNVEKVEMVYIIRDFDMENFNKRKDFVKEAIEKMNAIYGDGTIQLELRDQYYNMKEKLEDKMYIVERAFNAMKAVGVEPHIKPIRGGTDGARLSFMGLPCPNIFTGGDNYHGRYEYISVNSMKKAVEVIVKIAQI